MTPLELLQVLGAAAETGMMFARTTQGHQVRIGIVAGQVVHVSYALRRGGEALARLADAQCTSASFTRGLVAERHTDLPPHDLMMQLFGAILNAGSATMPTLSGPNTVPARAGPPTTVMGSQNSDVMTAPRARPVEDTRRAAAIGQLRRLMVEFVGPIGGLLVDQEVEAGFKSWTELVDRLAREVSPDAEAQTFRVTALRLGR
jgi:hypothetical protein